MQSLKGTAASRVVLFLSDSRPPYSVTEIAAHSQVSAATASKVVSLLEREALVVKEERGTVSDVLWADLIRRWTQDYAVLRSNVSSGYLEPRGVSALVEKLRSANLKYALSGTLASATSVAPARLALLYTPDADLAATKLGLRHVDVGANVIVLEPFDDVVFFRTRSQDGLVTAALSQVAADLLTSPGRGPTEGEELLQWMSANEDEWRN
ncbi:MAG: helix-turn-helix domain-containing protein [Myxococcota bacterium]